MKPMQNSCYVVRDFRLGEKSSCSVLNLLKEFQCLLLMVVMVSLYVGLCKSRAYLTRGLSIWGFQYRSVGTEFVGHARISRIIQKFNFYSGQIARVRN